MSKLTFNGFFDPSSWNVSSFPVEKNGKIYNHINWVEARRPFWIFWVLVLL